MKYFVRIGARTVEVDLQGDRVSVDGAPFDAHVADVPGTPLHHLLLSGVSWTVAALPLEGAPGRWVLGLSGERAEVEAVDERTRTIEALAPARPAAQGGVVRAPMPGLVVRVGVEPGQRVEAGHGLVVVEAMKMENELRAPHAGVVAEVHVAAGAAVEKGAPLVTLTSVEPSS